MRLTLRALRDRGAGCSPVCRSIICGACFAAARPGRASFSAGSAAPPACASRIIGTPLRSHVLFVSNHLSWLDIMLIAGASGAAFVSQ